MRQNPWTVYILFLSIKTVHAHCTICRTRDEYVLLRASPVYGYTLPNHFRLAMANDCIQYKYTQIHRFWTLRWFSCGERMKLKSQWDSDFAVDCIRRMPYGDVKEHSRCFVFVCVVKSKETQKQFFRGKNIDIWPNKRHIT